MYFGLLCYGYALNFHFVYLAMPGTRESKICLFCLYATTKSEINICSNKHETGLVVLHFCAIVSFFSKRAMEALVIVMQ